MNFYFGKHKQLIKFVSLSVVVHILVLFVISLQSKGELIKKTQVKELPPRIIKAQLIYQKAAVPPQKTKKKQKSDKPKKAKETATLVNEKPVDSEKKSIKKTKITQPKQAKIDTAKPKKTPVNNVPVNKAKPLKGETTKPVITEPPVTKILPKKSITSAEIRAASKNYFSTIPEPPPFNPEFSNGSTSIMAINNKAHAVPEHNSSIDNTGTMGAPRPTKVLCDNKLGVATAFMSGLTGGTVQCESLPDVRAFLKKRNKEKYNK